MNIANNRCRFSLYQLEDNDYFIKDYQGAAQFIHPSNKEEILNLTGKIIFSTKSIIFDSNDHYYSLTKFHFRNFQDKPKVSLIGGKDYLKIRVNRVLEIPTKPENCKAYDYYTDLILNFTYERIEITLQILFELYRSFNLKELNYDMFSEEYLATLYNFKFDYSRIVSIRENFLLTNEIFVISIIPLIEIPGIIMITDERLYFKPLFSMNSDFLEGCKIKLSSVKSLYKRYLKLMNSGIEIIAYSESKKSHKNLLLSFKNSEIRDNVYDLLLKQAESKLESDERTIDGGNIFGIENDEKPCIAKTNKISNNSDSKKRSIETNFEINKYTKLWVDGAISNYEYLMHINNCANRTKNDLSQYPVFPWVINDYSSDILRINDETIYRDLSKPIGALNKKRLQSFMERYKEMPEPKYIYGTHYSNPSYVIGFLFRKKPEWLLKLNGGKFDHPDRLFSSIENDWELCNNTTSSLKELTPEFYEDDNSFLLNILDIDFGENSLGKKISVSFSF